MYKRLILSVICGLVFPSSLVLAEQKPSPRQIMTAPLPFSTPVEISSLPTSALIETTKGAFEVEFYREEAPISVRNFVYLGKKGFYENLIFHRFVPGFILQGGDPMGIGKSGGPNYSLPGEFSEIKHEFGTIGMSRLASEVNPERRSNGSQFYITLGRAKHLDGLYSVFAKVISGARVVEQLRQNDKIISIKFPR